MTDDDIDTGPIVAGEVQPAPSEFPRVIHVPDDEKSRDEIVKEQLNVGLALAARGTESAEDYFKERQTQERFLDGEDLSPAQMREWHERTHAALERAVNAQARAYGEEPSQQQASVAQELPGYVAPDAADYDQHFEAVKERFSNYFDRPEKLGQKEVITEWLTIHDPKGELTGYYIASPLGPQMAEALANEPEVIPFLLSLPPGQQAQQMARLEGYLRGQQMLGEQNYASPQPRKFTQAPPPINPPRGGAQPPKDLFSMATRDDVKDYIETRRKQEYQARQERELEGWRR
jgi:hypothetical protein